MKDRKNILQDPRFAGIKPFEQKVWLSSPTMHGEELEYVQQAIETNWVSTVGENINELEKRIAEYLGMQYAVGLSCGTAALHLCMKLAAERINPGANPGNSLAGQKVFCTDMTFGASVNPVLYEGGEPIFIDSERETWNMDPAALEKAFELYPDVRVVVAANLYGTPGKLSAIQEICDRHGAILVEDAAESLGATYHGQQTGTFGMYNAISFNGNKIITGSAGGMLLTDDVDAANHARKWSTQSREAAPWYQHEEVGYNYRMSNVIAGVVRGQFPRLQEHIAQKKAIYERYKDGFKDLPVRMNPYIAGEMEPNFWLSCLLIDEDAMCRQVRSDSDALYVSETGKSCPTEILDTLAKYNAEGRPIWKPMHMQPLFRMHPFVTAQGDGRARTNAYIAGETVAVVDEDIFRRGLCLPSDNKMTEEQQEKIIEIVKGCFR